jgi:signal transduction histidine kinase
VVFQILDNGCGMDEETKNHIFDRFYQGDSSHTAEGNGIGLTVVEKIVHLHKGQISVVSEAGIGTTFTVNLPIIPPSSVL